jgi:hypothetical protein
LVREAVVFVDAHDPHRIVLKDGREYDIILDEVGGAIPDGWTPGEERLILDYDEKRGAAMVTMVSGLRLPLVGWADGRHPIEILLKRDLEANETTLGICEAYAGGARRWEREVERVNGELARHRSADEAARKALQKALRDWRRFHEADQRAYEALTRTQDGTRWQVMSAQYRYNRAREQARRLLELWGELR